MKLSIALSMLLHLLHEKSFSDSFQIQLPLTRHAASGRVASTPHRHFMSALSVTTEPPVLNQDTTDKANEPSSSSIRAPLKFMGPYPVLGLRFPHVATSAQRARNESGVTLDFVLDTAANTNTIHAQVAQELNLDVTGEPVLSVVGAGGPVAVSNENGLPTFLLGDAQLEGLGDDIFMQNLTASALPIASPASAGLLSLAFLQSIPGGIAFDWRGDASQQEPPSITFLDSHEDAMTHAANAQEEGLLQQQQQRVPITRIPVTQLPSVEVEINGHVFPALLDTGSPITVLNQAAALQAGIATVVEGDDAATSRNPFAALKGKWRQAQAAAEGKVLSIMGANGKPVNLIQSTDEWTVRLPTHSNDNNNSSDQDDSTNDNSVDFGPGHVYVGDLPGLAALQGLGVDAPPAVVLGMDVLRRKRHMLFRPRENEVWF